MVITKVYQIVGTKEGNVVIGTYSTYGKACEARKYMMERDPMDKRAEWEWARKWPIYEVPLDPANETLDNPCMHWGAS